MKEHPLFAYIRTIEEGKYISISDGTEYFLNLTYLRGNFPRIDMSYNDIRSYWTNPEDESFEKDGESIHYDRQSGNITYLRFKEHVPSIINPSFNIPMDTGFEFKKPYPPYLEKLLDNTLKLIKNARRSFD